jgi:type IV fimbrial biogenesis protein FimT
MSGRSLSRSRGAAVHEVCGGRWRKARPERVFRWRGFTLIELLVTLTVAGILLGLAMPSFSSYVENSRLSTETGTLAYALNLARSEAVKTDTTIEVCASSDGATCTGTWDSGWIVLCPANCPAGLGASPALLLVSPAVSTGNTVNEQISGATSVSFTSTGQNTSGDLRFVFCDRRGAGSGRDIEVNSIGEINPSSTPGQTVSGTALGGC